jgi:hypothetical protein
MVVLLRTVWARAIELLAWKTSSRSDHGFECIIIRIRRRRYFSQGSKSVVVARLSPHSQGSRIGDLAGAVTRGFEAVRLWLVSL